MKQKYILAAKISALLFYLALTTSLPTLAGISVIDGTNLTQNIVAAIENTSQTLKQIQEYQTQLQQYQNMLQNTMAPAVNIWDDAMTTMSNLPGAIDTLNHYMHYITTWTSIPNRTANTEPSPFPTTSGR